MDTKRLKLGFIPASIHEVLSEDWDGTLERLRAAGYSCIELHDLKSKTTDKNLAEATGLEPAAMRESLASHGFECASWFANWGDFGDNTAQTLETAKALGATNVIWGWAKPEEPGLMQQILPAMKAAAQAARQAGLTLLYHNHDHEFLNERDGQCAYDWLMAQFGPSELQAELDIGWVAYGGHDNVNTIRRYAGRVPILHLRDIADPKVRGDFIEVGDGTLDLAGILEAGLTVGGSRWAIVEHSAIMKCENPVDALIRAGENLKRTNHIIAEV